MKLIRCHIENFGCLSDFDYSFVDGLNVLYRPNGFGKSTLAAFIKAMFYGLPRTAKRVISENERKKYLPWQGGRYGGSLEFLYEDTCYRVTRFFGKTASADSFSLYDMTRRQDSTRFSCDLGGELFHLDADSFLRSTYMPQQQGKIDFSTDSIRAKLSNLVEDTNDINNYDTAVEKLKNKRTFYQAYRGSGGRVNELLNSREDLKSKLESLSSLREQLTEASNKLICCEDRYTELRQKRDSLQEQISALSTHEAKQVRYNTFTRLNNATIDFQSQLNELNQQYPAGYPSAEEINSFESYASKFSDVCRQLSELKEPLDAKELVQREQPYWEKRDVETDIQNAQKLLEDLNRVDGRLLQSTVSQEDQMDYHILHTQFRDGVPDVELRRSYLQKANERSEKIALCQSTKLSVADQENLERQRHFLGNTLPTEEEISDYEKAENDIARLTMREKNTTYFPSEEEKCSRRTLPFLFGGTTLLFGGIICLILSLPHPGIILAMIGAILLAIGFFASKRSGNVSRSEDSLKVLSKTESQQLATLRNRVLAFYQRFFPDENYRPGRFQEIRQALLSFQLLQKQEEEKARQRNELIRDIHVLEQQLHDFLTSYGLVPSDGDFRSALEQLNTKIMQYETLKKRLENEEKTTQQLNEEQNKLRRQLNEFAAAYQQDSDISALPQYIRQCRDSYLNAQKDLSSYQENFTQLTEQKEDIERNLQQVLTTYQLTGSYPELVQKLRKDKFEHDRLNKDLLKAQEELKQFLQKNPQAAEVPVQQTEEATKSLDRLSKERNALDSKINKIEQEERPLLRQERYNAQQKLEEMPQLQDQLDRINDEYLKATLARDRLDKAISFLEQAKTELSTSYVSQVEQQFQTYVQELIGNEMGEMGLNHELDVRLEQYGETHELGYYSVGSIDCIMLCMHLALADILFAVEPSFIILDDPFVNLDDARTERALALLEKLGNTRQILYLVCNSSRSIPSLSRRH